MAVTAAAVALKVALEPPAGTVTEPGTVRLAPLLEMPTAAPPAGAGEDRLTEQETAPGPVNDDGPQESELSAAAGRTVMTALFPVAAMLLPVAKAAYVAVNCTGTLLLLVEVASWKLAVPRTPP